MAASEPQMNLFARKAGPRIWTVTELTAEVRRMLEGRFATVWVAGEISNFRRQSSGHCYFSLKDDGAQLSAVLFRSQAARIRFDVADGLEVLAKGRVSVYAPRGQYQIIVDHLEPRGQGALTAAFEAMKKKLAAEGLFDAERKKPLPRLPRKVAVVTSPTGAAVRDFLRVAGRRHPGIPILIAPARVQGEGAAEEVARQIRRLDARGDADVIVVTRGGGSIEDLWAFNEEVVARAIAACTTPLVSAVGHEVDFTIADLVADLRAPTPSAAAEMVFPELTVLSREVRGLADRLRRATEAGLAARRAELERGFARVQDPRRLLSAHRLGLEALRERLEGVVAMAARDRTRALTALSERLGRQHPRARLHRDDRALAALARRLSAQHPEARIAALAKGLERLRVRLGAVTTRRLGEARRESAELAAKLDALSPLKVLDRGYGLVRRADGRVVRRSTDVDVGETIRVSLSEGSLDARVTGTDTKR